MRRLCLTVGLCAILAAPGFAQQARNDGKDDAKLSGENTATNSNPTDGDAAVTAPAPRTLFAMPATPKAKAFPAPEANNSSDEAPGLMVPKFELAAGYSYIHFNPGDPFASWNTHGGTGSFTYNANRWLGLTAEFGNYGFKRVVGPNNPEGGFFTYLFGPRLNYRKFNYFVPFAEFLVGGFRADGNVTGASEQS